MGGVAESASPSDFNTILTQFRLLSHTHTTNKQHNVTSGEEKWLEKFI